MEVDAAARKVNVAARKAEYDEKYPAGVLMFVLCSVAFMEGADAALFPSVTKALENLEDFDVKWLGYLATAQLLFQACAGPVWGIIASRGLLTRRTILTIGTFFQGLATLLMWMNLDVWVMCSLRAVNGVMLASLRPIACSIVGDRFDESVTGKYFSFLLLSLNLGAAVVSLGATAFSETLLWGSNFYGWKAAFVLVGLFSILWAPLIWLLLAAPPVVADKDHKAGVAGELRTLVRLFSRWTFAGLVLQGCLGLIPWRAFDFRTFFFETAHLQKAEAGIVSAAGGFAAAAGSVIGGFVGDALNRCWRLHGRILTAEISVFSGIPIAWLTFKYLPGAGQFWYYLSLTVSLALVAGWTPAGCNQPVLCSIATESERTLVLAWQTSLEGAVGALGPIMFSFLLGNVFGYDPACVRHPERADCANAEAAGNALFWTTCVPWLACGLVYTSLHYSYPRDLVAIHGKGFLLARLGADSRADSDTEASESEGSSSTTTTTAEG